MNASDAKALPIGVFDSGVGGLTVLKALRNAMPNENLLYLGDTARLPYGTKSPASISRYACQAATLLQQRDIKLLVVACGAGCLGGRDSATGREAPCPRYRGNRVSGCIQDGAAGYGCGRQRHRAGL
jgi:glutamate racemase